MDMRVARWMGICGVLAATLACGRVAKDHSQVIANVGGEKITEQQFAKTVQDFLGDPAKANDLLTKQNLRDARNQMLGTLVNEKALMQFVKAQGLDKDPQAKVQVESAVASAYFQVMLDRLVPKAEPTDDQLKSLYNDLVTQAKVAGQADGIPPYEQVKAQLPAAWKRKQEMAVRETLLNQLNQKVPVVFAPGYQPAQAQ